MVFGRFLGVVFLASAVAILAWDVVAYFDTNRYLPVRLRMLWLTVDENSAHFLETNMERGAGVWMWNYVLRPIWLAPVALVGLGAGTILAWAFRRRA